MTMVQSSRWIQPVLVLLAAASTLAAQQGTTLNQLTAAEKAAGWKLLFDGRTFQGWTPAPDSKPPGDSWAIDNGAIRSKPNPKFREDLLTTSEWDDFELAFSWKISPGGNSGVKYRVQDAAVIHPALYPSSIRKFEQTVDYTLQHKSPRAKMPADGKGQIYQVAFEYQVIDNTAHADAKRSQKSWAGALYQMIAPSENPVKAVGEWNEARIVVRGDRIEHWLNGKKVVDASLADPAVSGGLEQRWGKASPVYQLLTQRPKKKGPIVLQNHNDDAWFRNIRIRSLSR
jgi:hypothetical protein